MNASSASIGPRNTSAVVSSRRHISRTRCARNHAAFCEIPRSRCSLMLETPFSETDWRNNAISQVWCPSLLDCIGVPVRTENHFRQSRHWNGIVLCLLFFRMFMLPQPSRGQAMPFGQRHLMKVFSAATSFGQLLEQSSQGDPATVRLAPSLLGHRDMLNEGYRVWKVTPQKNIDLYLLNRLRGEGQIRVTAGQAGPGLSAIASAESVSPQERERRTATPTTMSRTCMACLIGPDLKWSPGRLPDRPVRDADRLPRVPCWRRSRIPRAARCRAAPRSVWRGQVNPRSDDGSIEMIFSGGFLVHPPGPELAEPGCGSAEAGGGASPVRR